MVLFLVMCGEKWRLWVCFPMLCVCMKAVFAHHFVWKATALLWIHICEHVSLNVCLFVCASVSMCMCPPMWRLPEHKPHTAHPSESTLYFELALFSSLPPSSSPLLNVTICQPFPFLFFIIHHSISVSSSSSSASFSCSPHLVFNPSFLFIL